MTQYSKSALVVQFVIHGPADWKRNVRTARVYTQLVIEIDNKEWKLNDNQDSIEDSVAIWRKQEEVREQYVLRW